MKLSIHGVELDESTPLTNLPRRPVLTRITKNLCTADHTQAEPHLEGVGEVLEELAAGHSVIFTAKMRATDLLFLMQVLKESKPFAKYNVTFGTGSIEDPLRNVVLWGSETLCPRYETGLIGSRKKDAQSPTIARLPI